MSSWLSKQKKADLVDLADEAGFRGGSSMRKEELAAALDDHLTKNATSLNKKAALAPYYSHTSPSKSSGVKTEGDEKPKAKARRTTKAPGDLPVEAAAEEVVATAKSLAKATPKTVQKAAARVPLPASPVPVAVTNFVERQSNILSTRAKKIYRSSGLSAYAEAARARLSTVIGVQLAFLALEAWGLSRATIPWRYAFSLGPAIKIFSNDPFRVSFPDFFVLLTSDFWSPSSLWVLTSILIPLVFAWLFNPTSVARRSHHHDVDPLVFNVVKALVSWLVYSQGNTLFGLFSKRTAYTVSVAVPGGVSGILIGSGVTGLIALYEAVLKK